MAAGPATAASGSAGTVSGSMTVHPGPNLSPSEQTYSGGFTVTGTFTAGGQVAVGSLTCGMGGGGEGDTIEFGAVRMTLDCWGTSPLTGETLSLFAPAATMTRSATVAVISGLAVLNVGPASGVVSLDVNLAMTPSSTPPINAYALTGTFAAVGA